MKIMKHKASMRLLFLTLLVVLSEGSAWSQTNIEITQTADSDLIRFTTVKAGHHHLEIDDAAGFVAPVTIRNFNESKLELHANEVGLIPGIAYHLRLDGEREVQDLRLLDPVKLDARVSCATLHHTWESSTRFSIGTGLSGLKWVGNHWEIAPHTFLLGESLYNAEMLMRPALSAARACGDMQTLDEMAQYYVIMLSQTEIVGELLKRPRVTAETKARLSSTDPSARTFSATFGSETGEAELYNSQWLHPASLLVRVVTLLPDSSRTPAMKSFASLYAQFIVKDQLERYLFRQHVPPLGGIEVEGRVARWEASMRGLKGRDPWDSAMSDIDLWLLASTAEILGANANDPHLVPIDKHSLALLHTAVTTGIRFFESKRTSYPETKNFKGEVVGSASYFNGDYASHSDMAFSAVGGAALPSASQQSVNPNVSWDISHAYRIPIFLRALYENRKALGSEFPRYKDLQLIDNQYIYKVFTGNYSRPQFKNFFDGSDGWLRVGFNGTGFGHPPSDFCDMRNPQRPCLMPGAIIGWAELSFASVDLARLERSLVDLAFVKDPATVEFRDRHYFYSTPYKVNVVDGFDVYGGALYYVIAENADRISTTNGPQPEN